MKRRNNIYQKIISIPNLVLADKNARKGKSGQSGVKDFDENKPEKIVLLHEMLKNKTFKTSPYKTFFIYEPKERVISMLPYFPDRIVHWAVMNELEKIFVETFTADTYSCIKKKGIHAASNALSKAMLDVPGTQYCLKLDIKKFYPNVDHQVLKNLLRRKFKDRDLLWLLDEIIDSSPGLPIGNYLSQYFANFYLSYFDHWIKEVKGVKYYFRYADDLVILSDSKVYLHKLLFDIRQYMEKELKLAIKGNYQVFPVEARGVDFVGYPTFHKYKRLRKGIKKNMARMIVYRKNPASLASYMGWAKHCNSKNLIKKLLNERV